MWIIYFLILSSISHLSKKYNIGSVEKSLTNIQKNEIVFINCNCAPVKLADIHIVRQIRQKFLRLVGRRHRWQRRQIRLFSRKSCRRRQRRFRVRLHRRPLLSTAEDVWRSRPRRSIRRFGISLQSVWSTGTGNKSGNSSETDLKVDLFKKIYYTDRYTMFVREKNKANKSSSISKRDKVSVI